MKLMSQWPHIFKQMVEISLLISVSCCALVPLCFGLGVWNYTCREERLKVTLDPGQCLAAGSLPLFFGKSLLYEALWVVEGRYLATSLQGTSWKRIKLCPKNDWGILPSPTPRGRAADGDVNQISSVGEAVMCPFGEMLGLGFIADLHPLSDCNVLTHVE